MNNRVSITTEDRVATVTLDRPDKKNAVDSAMFDAIAEAAAAIESDKSIRAVVLTGEGSDFCAGIDITSFAGDGIAAGVGDKMAPRTPSGANYFQQAATCWRELPVPVIAALRGVVFGAGFQIAMGADIRFAAPDTRMSIMEIKWGIIPDMGITATLPGVIAQDRARELAYTGRVVAAEEAAAIGLVTGVIDDPLTAARMMAADIAGKSPDAIRAIKQLINRTWQQDPAPSLRLEAELQMAVMSGGNQREAAAANIEKRPPAFRDPK